MNADVFLQETGELDKNPSLLAEILSFDGEDVDSAIRRFLEQNESRISYMSPWNLEVLNSYGKAILEFEGYPDFELVVRQAFFDLVRDFVVYNLQDSWMMCEDLIEKFGSSGFFWISENAGDVLYYKVGFAVKGWNDAGVRIEPGTSFGDAMKIINDYLFEKMDHVYDNQDLDDFIEQIDNSDLTYQEVLALLTDYDKDDLYLVFEKDAIFTTSNLLELV